MAGTRFTLAMLALALSFSAVGVGWCAGAGRGKESAALKTILDRVQEHYEQTHTLSAEFSEKITGLGGVNRTRSGRVYYRKPGRFRWDFDSPQKETIVSDGKMVYDYQPDLNQVLEMPLARAFHSASPVAFLLGFGDLRRDYVATLPAGTPVSGKLVRVALAPRQGGERLELGVAPRTFDLRTVTVIDAVGNRTAIVFTNVRRNVQLADSLFQFKVPAGADIVSAPAAPPGRGKSEM